MLVAYECCNNHRGARIDAARAASVKRWLILILIGVVAIAAWPLFGTRYARASYPYVAPVLPDYSHRDQTVVFYEREIREDPLDQIAARMLAAQYMARYRETLDVGDILRGIREAKRALVLQPYNDAAAQEIMASGYYALHKFHTALALESNAHLAQPSDVNAPAQMALLEMEMGHYEVARHDLDVARHIKDNEAVWSAQARYDEMTGNLAQAKILMARASEHADAIIDNPASARAWYHYRLGQMEFSSGHVAKAEDEERIALIDFPGFEMGYRALARFCWGDRDWTCALDAAKKGAAIIPEPETLGYEADAQQALGDAAGAKQTQALIGAVERIGNAYHINDRLLSVYYSEHGVRLNDSLQIARREAAKRGNEVHAQDTLAWAAAMDGQWSTAYRAMSIATRFHTQDPRVLFHAGMIELHFGHRNRAEAYLKETLALNPRFDPVYGSVARDTLATLSPTWWSNLRRNL